MGEEALRSAVATVLRDDVDDGRMVASLQEIDNHLIIGTISAIEDMIGIRAGVLVHIVIGPELVR